MNSGIPMKFTKIILHLFQILARTMQIEITMKGLKEAQAILNRMQIQPPWMNGNDGLFKIVFPIEFLMGDTPAYDKLCCIQNQLNAKFICCMCKVHWNKHDDLRFILIVWWLGDKNLLDQHDHNAIDKLGYKPCYKNVLFDLQYLDSWGLNMALPLESMHVICLGYMPHIVQAFSQVQKIRAGSATEDDTNWGTHYVLVNFTKIMSRWKIN